MNPRSAYALIGPLALAVSACGDASTVLDPSAQLTLTGPPLERVYCMAGALRACFSISVTNDFSETANELFVTVEVANLAGRLPLADPDGPPGAMFRADDAAIVGLTIYPGIIMASPGLQAGWGFHGVELRNGATANTTCAGNPCIFLNDSFASVGLGFTSPEESYAFGLLGCTEWPDLQYWIATCRPGSSAVFRFSIHGCPVPDDPYLGCLSLQDHYDRHGFLPWFSLPAAAMTMSGDVFLCLSWDCLFETVVVRGRP